MASYAGEGTSREGGGGVGGKFRKHPFRKPSSTPYDRPPTALRSPNTDGGWFSKIITPASKLVTSSAQLFFSSLLRKRIAPPPQQSQPEVGRGSTESVQEAVPISPRVHQSAVDDQKCSLGSFDGSGISEIEHTLKQRTFTRSEINHLLNLLDSRKIEVPNKDNDRRAETSLGGLPVFPTVLLDKVADSQVKARNESYLESQKSAGWISSPVINLKVPEDDVSSPAELAKAYMGNRASEVSPSMLRMRGQVHKEDAMLRTIVPFSPKISTMSVLRTRGRTAIPENGFITPRSLGRSSIYNMARTPYSKVHPASTQKTLKRRSAMEDDEYGSVGPIRRLRQKTNLSTPNSLNRFVARAPLTGDVLDVVQDPSSSTKAVLSLNESDCRIPIALRKSGKGNYTSVPSKSTAVANRILEQLDKLVPKEQSPKFKPVMTGKSPNMLTTDMLQGQYVKSLENGDSSQILQGLPDPQIHRSFSHTYNDAISTKHNKMEENGQALPSENITSTSTKKTSPSVGIAAPLTESVSEPLNKRGFQMSAHKHSGDIDHHTNSDEAARKYVTEGERELKELVAQGKSFPKETMSSISPVAQTTTGSGSFSAEKMVASNGTASQLKFDHKVADTVLPLFSFSSKHVDKVPSPKFSVPSSIIGTSNTKSSPPSEIKVTSTNRFPIYSSGPANSSYQISASEKGANIDSKATAEEMLKSVPSFSIPVPTSATTTNILGFGNVADKLSNGDYKDMKAYSVSAAVPTSSSASSIFTVSNLANKSDMMDKNVQPTAAEATVQPPASVSTAIPTSSSNIFSVGNSESKLIPSNGLFSTSFNSSTPGSFTSQAALTNGFSQTPNGTVTAFTPSATLSKSGAASDAPSTSTASQAVSADLKSKNEKETAFGSNIFGSSSSLPSGTWPAATKSKAVELGASSTVFGNNSGMNSTISPFCSSSQNIFSSGVGVGANTSSTTSMFGTGTLDSRISPFCSSSQNIFSSSMEMGANTSSTASMFGSTALNSATSPFCSSSQNIFSSSMGVGANISSTTSMFGSSTLSSTSTSDPTMNIFSSSASPTSSFVFGQSNPSAAATVSSPSGFGSVFSLSSATAPASASNALTPPTTTTTTFGSSFPAFTTTPSINNNNNGDQQMMNMDSSMNEDIVQSSSLPVFSQQLSAAPPFQFGSTTGPSFQFSQVGSSNPPPSFQASGSVEFGAGGGSFSLGTGGDKSNRKFVRVKHKNRRK